MDVVHLPVTEQSHDPRDFSPVSDRESKDAAVSRALALIYAAKTPSIIVDALVARHLAVDVARQLVDLFQFPTFTTSMGKAIIHETKPYFVGVYNGQVSLPEVCQIIEEKSDLVIDIGPFLSDSNTGGFSRKLPGQRVIAVNRHNVTIAGVKYADIGLKGCKFAHS